VPLLEADTFALRSSARAAGLASGEEEELIELWNLECAALREGIAPTQHAPLLEAIAKARAKPWFARLPYEATSPDSWWVGWYPLVMGHDPSAALEALRIPTLWLYGGQDTQSELAANLTRLGTLAPGRPWSIHVFPGGDHGILVPLFEDDPSGPRTMAEGYFELLLAWLAREGSR
jgi:pimeloyl-ACP methyl ester carboxylesterase